MNLVVVVLVVGSLICCLICLLIWSIYLILSKKLEDSSPIRAATLFSASPVTFSPASSPGSHGTVEYSFLGTFYQPRPPFVSANDITDIPVERDSFRVNLAGPFSSDTSSPDTFIPDGYLHLCAQGRALSRTQEEDVLNDLIAQGRALSRTREEDVVQAVNRALSRTREEDVVQDVARAQAQTIAQGRALSRTREEDVVQAVNRALSRTREEDVVQDVARAQAQAQAKAIQFNEQDYTKKYAFYDAPPIFILPPINITKAKAQKNGEKVDVYGEWRSACKA